MKFKILNYIFLNKLISLLIVNNILFILSDNTEKNNNIDFLIKSIDSHNYYLNTININNKNYINNTLYKSINKLKGSFNYNILNTNNAIESNLSNEFNNQKPYNFKVDIELNIDKCKLINKYPYYCMFLSTNELSNTNNPIFDIDISSLINTNTIKNIYKQLFDILYDISLKLKIKEGIDLIKIIDENKHMKLSLIISYLYKIKNSNLNYLIKIVNKRSGFTYFYYLEEQLKKKLIRNNTLNLNNNTNESLSIKNSSTLLIYLKSNSFLDINKKLSVKKFVDVLMYNNDKIKDILDIDFFVEIYGVIKNYSFKYKDNLYFFPWLEIIDSSINKECFYSIVEFINKDTKELYETKNKIHIVLKNNVKKLLDNKKLDICDYNNIDSYEDLIKIKIKNISSSSEITHYYNYQEDFLQRGFIKLKYDLQELYNNIYSSEKLLNEDIIYNNKDNEYSLKKNLLDYVIMPVKFSILNENNMQLIHQIFGMYYSFSEFEDLTAYYYVNYLFRINTSDSTKDIYKFESNNLNNRYIKLNKAVLFNILNEKYVFLVSLLSMTKKDLINFYNLINTKKLFSDKNELEEMFNIKYSLFKTLISEDFKEFELQSIHVMCNYYEYISKNYFSIYISNTDITNNKINSIIYSLDQLKEDINSFINNEMKIINIVNYVCKLKLYY